MQDTGRRFVVIFEGRDAAGKGSTIKRFMEHLNPRAARGRRPRYPHRARAEAMVFPALYFAPAHGRGGRPIRPFVVQPCRGREGHGLLHRRAV
jgi:hypothetical protein